MPDFKLPLSGDVSKAINPWNWFFDPVGSQTGLINVRIGASADPQTEREVLDKVGSYGRQLGRIGDALRVLVKRVPKKKLKKRERNALRALIAQLDAIDEVKLSAG